jgi:hypothetical protein
MIGDHIYAVIDRMALILSERRISSGWKSIIPTSPRSPTFSKQSDP